MTVSDTNQETRRRWLAVLARAPREALEAAAGRLQPPAGEAVRVAETGMVMLRGRVGGTGSAFNLGEASVSRCAVRIGQVLGVGYALGRDKRKAELIAGFDALLQDATWQPVLLRELVEPLEREQAQQRDARSRLAASSRVDFFTMVRGEA